MCKCYLYEQEIPNAFANSKYEFNKNKYGNCTNEHCANVGDLSEFGPGFGPITGSAGIHRRSMQP